jgi:hypothetical protein
MGFGIDTVSSSLISSESSLLSELSLNSLCDWLLLSDKYRSSSYQKEKQKIKKNEIKSQK